MIEVKGVTKRYGSTTVLHDVTVDIPTGGITSILGANGAGKSTLLSIIGRLLPADEGVVLVDGLDVATAPSKQVARQVSILRQENHLNVRLTVRDLVGFGRFPHSQGRLRPEDDEHIEQSIEFLELGPFTDRYLDQLSGGQRQRAFVAMVLCQDTPYVLLDEPLNNLDLRHSVHMMRLLRQAARELGRTIVLVVHDINFASCHSDHIIAMKDGQVVAAGDPGRLIDPEALRLVYDLDIEVHDIGGRRIGVYYS